MKGYYLWMIWSIMILLIYFIGYPLLAILISLLAILDTIIQMGCGVWKRLDITTQNKTFLKEEN